MAYLPGVTGPWTEARDRLKICADREYYSPLKWGHPEAIWLNSYDRESVRPAYCFAGLRLTCWYPLITGFIRQPTAARLVSC